MLRNRKYFYPKHFVNKANEYSFNATQTSVALAVIKLILKKNNREISKTKGEKVSFFLI